MKAIGWTYGREESYLSLWVLTFSVIVTAVRTLSCVVGTLSKVPVIVNGVFALPQGLTSEYSHTPWKLYITPSNVSI